MSFSKKITFLIFLIISFYSLRAKAIDDEEIMRFWTQNMETEKGEKLYCSEENITGKLFCKSSQNKAYTGIARSYYKHYLNRILLAEYYLKSGTLTGQARTYWLDGKLHEDMNFDMASGDGYVKSYYENGCLEKEVKLVNKKKYSAKFFYDNCQLKEEDYFNNGEIEKVISYDKTGNKFEEDIFLSGKVASSTVFYPNGQVALELNEGENPRAYKLDGTPITSEVEIAAQMLEMYARAYEIRKEPSH